MHYYKKIALIKLLIMIAFTGYAQKEVYDVISYTLPAGWKKDPKEKSLQIYITDNKTGEYALALMVNSTESSEPASGNFNKFWATMVKGTVNVSEEPTMLPPVRDHEWDITSGWANYTDGANKGIVTQKTATGYGKMTTVIVMTNTRKYQTDLDNLLNSIEFTALTTIQEQNTSPSTGVDNPSIAGLWVRYLVETSGTFSNGMPMLTAGYFRYEYRFNPDGTYRYLEKTFSIYSKNIIFGYETGTWSVNGDKLTIKPLQGKSEEWSKSASGRTSEWGSRVKSVNRKLETVTYTYKLYYYSGMNETDLLLQYAKPTERDGRQSNDDNHVNEWSYSPRALDKSLIDLPPGTKISFDARR